MATCPAFYEKKLLIFRGTGSTSKLGSVFQKKKDGKVPKMATVLGLIEGREVGPPKMVDVGVDVCFWGFQTKDVHFLPLAVGFFLGNSYAPPLVQAPVRWRNVLVLSRSRCVACSMVGRMAGDVFFLLPCDFKTFGMGELFASSSMLFSRDKESKVCSLGSTTKKCHSDWETRVRTLTQKISI